MSNTLLRVYLLVVGLIHSVTGLDALADEVPMVPSPGSGPMAADSVFSDFDARMVVFILMAGVLVTILIGGGILVVNLGMLSRRDQDKVGGRVPSDVGLLKNSVWPEEHEEQNVFPAREEKKRVRLRSVNGQRLAESTELSGPPRTETDEPSPETETLKVDPKDRSGRNIA
jgi:hypothetical protein